ncbi:hypothetical protein D3C81_2026870 [compost metagenome]
MPSQGHRGTRLQGSFGRLDAHYNSGFLILRIATISVIRRAASEIIRTPVDPIEARGMVYYLYNFSKY